jgi:hypothetical protein
MIEWHAIAYAVRHNPLPVLGLVLIGAGSAMWWHLHVAMARAGYQTRMLQQLPNDMGLPGRFLSVRKRHGWPAWPAYLVWPCLILGGLLLFIGVAFGRS